MFHHKVTKRRIIEKLALKHVTGQTLYTLSVSTSCVRDTKFTRHHERASRVQHAAFRKTVISIIYTMHSSAHQTLCRRCR